MGHIRLGKLPSTRKWQQVVTLLADGAPVREIAAASAEAAEAALGNAADDPALLYSFWLLTQLPIAARSPDFEGSLASLDMRAPNTPSLMDMVAAFSDSVDRHVQEVGGRTDLGELAQLAAVESFTTVVGSDLPILFGPTPDDVRLAIGRLAARDRFAWLARDFLARLTQRYLDYYLSRTLSDHVGEGERFSSVDDHSEFNQALEQHCREASRIVQTFAGAWFSKTHFEGGITPEKAGAFLSIAFRKVRQELRKRSGSDA